MTPGRLQLIIFATIAVSWIGVGAGRIEAQPASPAPSADLESTFRSELSVAGSSIARSRVAERYLTALMARPLSPEQKQTLVEKKVQQLSEVDFYGLYLWYNGATKNPDHFKVIFMATRKILTDAQRSVLTYYLADAVYRQGVLVKNVTTGVTAPMEKPARPTYVPEPGFGWGKVTTSDPPPQAPAGPKYTKEKLQQMFGGKWFTYPTETFNEQTSMSYTVAIVCKVVRIDSEHAILLACRTSHSQPEQYKTVSAEQLLSVKMLKRAYTTCVACQGGGMTTSTSSHTNDYSLTLGQKHVYTTRTTDRCIRCSGCGWQPADYDPIKDGTSFKREF